MINMIFKKGEVVTLISKGDKNVITIINKIVLSSGSQTTRLENGRIEYDTHSLLGAVIELPKLKMMPDQVIPNEEYISAYIERADEIRLNSLSRANENLKQHPSNRRYQNHKKLHIDEIIVLDKRV